MILLAVIAQAVEHHALPDNDMFGVWLQDYGKQL